MGKYEQKRAAAGFNGETGSNAGAALSEAGNARRSFLGRIGRWTAALSMFGLAGETGLRALSKRSIVSSAMAEGGPGSVPPPTLLFASNFEGNVQFSNPYGCGGTSCWQDIVGGCSDTGMDFRNLSVLNGGYQGHLITGDDNINTSTVNDWHKNEVATTTGPYGNETRAAHFQIFRRGGQTQNVFGYTAEQASPPERLYWKYWLKMEADLAAKLGTNGWVSFWAWKTNNGDYRLTSQIWTNSTGKLIWNLQGDNEANANRPYELYFRLHNTVVSVPTGEWCKVEVFYDRSGNGRVWQAINGVVVFDTTPPNIAVGEVKTAHKRNNLYGVDNGRLRQGTFLTVRNKERDVWLDEFEVWDNFPPDPSDSPVPPQSPGGIEVTKSQRFRDTA